MTSLQPRMRGSPANIRQLARFLRQRQLYKETPSPPLYNWCQPLLQATCQTSARSSGLRLDKGPEWLHWHRCWVEELGLCTRGRSRIWKRSGARGYWARPQDFFGQFRGIIKEFGAKKGVGMRPLRHPSGSAPVWRPQLPLDNCCRVLPYHAVRHTSDGTDL